MQLQLDEDLKEIKKLGVENERLKAEVQRLKEPSFIVPMPRQTGVPLEQYEELLRQTFVFPEIIHKLINILLEISYACALTHTDPHATFDVTLIENIINKFLVTPQDLKEMQSHFNQTGRKSAVH